MIGVELVESKKTRKPLAGEKVLSIFEHTKNMGILIGKGGLGGNGIFIFEFYNLNLFYLSSFIGKQSFSH